MGNIAVIPGGCYSFLVFYAIGICQEFRLFIPYHMSALEFLSKCANVKVRELGSKTFGLLDFMGETHHVETHLHFMT